jgi:hypothetical protein
MRNEKNERKSERGINEDNRNKGFMESASVLE